MKAAVLFLTCLLAAGCRSSQAQAAPSIEFTRVPPAGEGNAFLVHPIAGRVKGARPNQRVVLFAQSGMWWVQPLADQPFTTIQRDSTWKSSTHPGSAYAALVVDPGYKPPLTLNVLPQKGGLVEAVVTAEGAKPESSDLKKLNFSGYEWSVRQTPGSPAGSPNQYASDNAWVDAKGLLHLRIRQTPAGWTSAEVSLVPSLGYGWYRFAVSDISGLEPAAVLTISSWDGSGADREMDIEISRWGEPAGENSQYVVQPYDVAANVVRFLSPAGQLTYSFDWGPGRVAFRTTRGGSLGDANLVAAHVFTSGVPAPGNEKVQLNLYVFDNRRIRMQHGVEVVVEKFDYLP